MFEEVNKTNIEERTSLPKLFWTVKLAEEITHYDKVLDEIVRENNITDLGHLNNLMYSVAYLITKKFRKVDIKQQRQRNTLQDPPWKTRIRKRIEEKRKEISKINEWKRNNRTQRVQYKIKQIMDKYKPNNIDQIEEASKQRVSAWALRIRRYEKRRKAFTQNRSFENDKKKFYRELYHKNYGIEQPPSKEEFENFWTRIWGIREEVNIEADWITNEFERTKNLNEMNEFRIEESDITNTMKDAHNWKAPGIDKLTNFWLKYLKCMHKHLAASLQNIMEHPTLAPDWLTQGITYLLPKNENTHVTKNYRPITCLPVLYKLLTGIMKSKIHTHLQEKDLLPVEQKGGLTGSMGCKDHLLVNKLITEDSKQNKSLGMSWIDYQKAYDSVPHEWILTSLKIYKINAKTRDLLKSLMESWKTKILVQTNQGRIETEEIYIRKGIFQGDALSPLLFCIALIPLSTMLNNSRIGYKLRNQETKVNHLLYMDDVKLYANNERRLNTLIEIVKTFSDDIGMKFGLDKCAKVIIDKGKVRQRDNILEEESTLSIRELESGESYKYLGVLEDEHIDQKKMKVNIKKEYIRRVRLTLQTELNSKNKIEALNSLAVPVVEYGFGIIDWTKEEIRKFDRKTRKLLTMNKCLHPKSDVDRIYLPRKDGGKGLRSIEQAYEISILGLAEYIKHKENDYLIHLLKESHVNSNKNILRKAENIETQYIISRRVETTDLKKRMKQFKNQVKEQQRARLLTNWKSKRLHGQFLKVLDNATFDKINTRIYEQVLQIVLRIYLRKNVLRGDHVLSPFKIEWYL
ncbi:hypothetical protein M8J77_003330 [Diaphorina citri]|nr:hypothetical protein M8J77_003330 [Diaphorina citri]